MGKDKRLEAMIHIVRGRRVMLDSNLAQIYGVSTKRLNEQVRRNPRRFPSDFMLTLTREEAASLRSQIATLKGRGQHRKLYAPENIMSRQRHHREEVFNVELARLLSEGGLEANPEMIEAEGRPDVMVNMGGIKVVLEGRFGNEQSLIQTIRERVQSGLADIAIALHYPLEMQDATSLPDVRRRLKSSRFKGAICSLANVNEPQIFDPLNHEELGQLINSTFGLLVNDTSTAEAIDRLEASVEKIVLQASSSGLFFKSEALIARLKASLGVADADG